MWYRIFGAPPPLHVLVGAALITCVAAYVIAFLTARVVRSVLVAIVGGKDVAVVSSPAISRPVRWIGLTVFLLTAAAFFFPAVELFGVRPHTGLPLHTLSDWFFDSGLRVLLIAILAYMIIGAAALLIRRFEEDLSRGTGLDVLERAKRAKTLGGLLSNIVVVGVVALAALMMLRELKVDIVPLLTGAGVAGVALGFGAQTLVRDVIAGFFLILEGQVRVGDVVSVNNVGGLVEAINLRTIVLRDFDGTVHIIPNGTINLLSNRAREFAYAVLTVNVGYESDTDRVVALLKTIGSELQADPAWQPNVLAPIEVTGIDSLGDWAVAIQLRMKTPPLKQWDVSRELRRRIKKTFEANGIRFPRPAQDVAVLKSS